MYSRTGITKSTGGCWDKIQTLREKINDADAVVVGAGAGLSASAGLTYGGKRFQENFGDFIRKYGLTDMYSAGFYPFETREEYWAYWSRHIFLNRYGAPAGTAYANLLKLLQNKDYFVITTNVDHQFQKAGFDKRRLFYTQGDYGLFQCAEPCHQKTYENEPAVRKMVQEQRDMKIPAALVPHCPRCGKQMAVNLRCDNRFVQDEGWYQANERYQAFLNTHKRSPVLFLELGVGMNTPGIIKFPFWKMTAQNPYAFYTCINLGPNGFPPEIREQSLCIEMDIGKTFANMA